MTRLRAFGASARQAPRRELAVVLLASAILVAVYTYPIAFKLGHVGRVDNGDGQLSIWNVAWVARTLVVDPLHVFDANIFYPNRGALAYSENNLGAGLLAVPAYWTTLNPYAAHNSVVLLAFVLAFAGAYYLVRHLTGVRRAAFVSAMWFAFCPFTFARTAHIQLLMTAGLPFAMLAFHRLADRPSAGRGAALGVAMAAQALACGYYGIFVILMVGFGAAVIASTRRLWTSARYWTALAVAAIVSIAIVAPAFVPYLALQRSGFHRVIGETARYSANWSAYFASSSFAHAWLLSLLPRWTDVLFPGVLVTVFGVAGIVVARRQGRGEVSLLYGGLAGLAFWTSFGPAGRLHSALYAAIPLFAWLRAPSRFGLIVVFALAVLGGVAVSGWLQRVRRPAVAFAALLTLAGAELLVPLNMPEVPPVEPVYVTLASLPRGPVIELPFFYLDYMFPRHTYYMLQSTKHWMPLVNGYSDYIPPDFLANVMTLAPFPSRDSLKLLEPNRVRYALFHRYWYNDENWRDVAARLKEFGAYLRPLYADEGTQLYEILAFPP
jgi:hypothetical protein